MQSQNGDANEGGGEDHQSGDDDDDESILDNGLYCDFVPRSSGGASSDDGDANSSWGGGGGDNNNNAGGSGASASAGRESFGGALRSSIAKLVGGGGGGAKKKKRSQESRPRPVMRVARGGSSTSMMGVEPAAAAAAAAPKSAKVKFNKPRRRRGSHMMPEAGGGGSSAGAGRKMPSAAATGAGAGPGPMDTESIGTATATPTTTAAVATATSTSTSTKAKSAKPRRRRGSHMMPESGTGQAKPTSQALRQQQQQPPPAAATPSPSPTTSNATKPKSIKKAGPRRRGSDMMPPGMAATYSAAAAPPPEEAGGGPNTAAVSAINSTPTPTPTVKKSGPRRRGSNMMPPGIAATYSAAAPPKPPPQAGDSIAAAVAQAPDLAAQAYKPVVNTTTAAAATVKMSSGGGSPRRRGSDMMPQGQMQQLSVTAKPVSTRKGGGRTPAPSDADAEPSPMDTSESSASNNNNAAPPPPTTKHVRARRRGSVVKTLVGSTPKSVDGDGTHIARASTNAASYDAAIGQEGYDVSERSSGSTNQHLPRRRSSQDSISSGGSRKRPVAKHRRSSEIGGPGGTARRKKKDIGRKAIRSMAADLDYVHKVTPKSNDAKEMIYDAIKPNILFRACSPEELVDLVDAFEPQYVPKGSVVIREGDEGDHFYVMERGGVDVYEKDLHKCSLYSGVAFGEIALLYSCPRTATVMAKHDCKLWVIDRRAFRGITAQHKKRQLEKKLEFLRKVKIHDKVLGDILKSSEIHSMALATKIEKFREGDTIVRQGERGDAFYMIEEGAVDVFIREKGSNPIVTLEKGSFFGEKALLSSDVRTATCVASSDVKCMLMMREDFVLMLGNLQDLLDRSYIARDEALRAEQDAMLQKESHPKTQRFDKDDFDIKRTLGVGAFGFVKLVQWKLAPAGDKNSFFALKCVSKEKIRDLKQQEKIKREEDIMKSLVHPFIARCYNVMEDDRGKYFLMEALCGGELCELLYHETQFPEEWSIFYSASVLSAFALMHERKIAYRDLKPENLVLDSLGHVKIVDFGLAKVVNSGQTYTFCGTPDYLAPEVILNEGYDWAVDYWGLGVLVYEMTAGVAPFYAESPMETYEKALSGHVHIPAHFSHAAANLIRKLLHTSQSKRIGRTVGGAATVMRHPWFSGFDWDAHMQYKLQVPYVPEMRDPDDESGSMDEEETEGFATAFL